MHSAETPRTVKEIATAAWCLASGISGAILIAGMITALAPQPAQATAAYTKQTGLPCMKCHTAPTGGADHLTDFGKQFQANGHQVK